MVPSGAENAVSTAIEKVWHSSKIWNCLIQLIGRTLELHKATWRMLAHKVIDGKLKIIATPDEEMVMEDGLGGYVVIEFGSPDQPNDGLGYHIRGLSSQVIHA